MVVVSNFPGAHVPVTMEGNIVVDGVLASCYAFSDHDLAHFGMTPIRLFPEIMEWLLGEEEDSPAYVNIVKDLGKITLPFLMKD